MPRSVLIIGSAPDAVQAQSFDFAKYEAIVVINNAWRIRPDWTHLIHPDDFPEDRRTKAQGEQRIVTSKDYVPANNAFGGIIYAGGTMAFSASYWTVHFFKPEVLAIQGCDMVYGEGSTHFYGTGEPDPLRKDPTLQSLEAKSARLMLLAALNGCLCVNHSKNEQSRLIWPRVDPAKLEELQTDTIQAQLTRFTSGGTLRTIEYILQKERELNAFAESGDYWNMPELPDAGSLKEIDHMWLDAYEKAPRLTL